MPSPGGSRPAKPRPAEQRAAENGRYRGRQQAVGIVKATVMVPSDRLPDLRAVTLAWRREAMMMLESDQPSADQILQIHAVSRTLRVALPVAAFETRATAANWLLAHESRLGAIRARLPRSRSPR